MIHILLMILKIIGIILLVILGILLVLILAVLFVPVRYKADFSWHGEPDLSLKASWFLHLLSFRAIYTKEGLKFVVRVLGINLLRKHDRDALKDAADAVKDGTEDVLGKEEQTLYDELEEDEANFRKSAQERKDSGGYVEADEGNISGGTQSEGTNAPDDPETDGEKAAGKDAAPAFGKLLSLPGRIKSRVKAVWEKLRFSFTRIRDKLKGMQAFALDKKAWLEDEKNQASLKLLYRQVKRLIAHIWPRKGKGSVTFGFDDPYTTGQVLQAVSLIYPFFHKQLAVYPVFDDKVLDAEGSFKGRVRLAYPLWLVFQVFMDKHTRRMIRGFIK